MKRLIPKGRVVAFDTETTGGNFRRGAAPFAFSFCNEKGRTGYIEFPVDPKTRRVMYEKKPREFRILKRWLADDRVAKVMHNAKFDVRAVTLGMGVDFHGVIHETMFAAHCCNSSEMTFALKPLAKKYAGISDEDQKKLQAAVNMLRRRAKKRGWAIAGGTIEDGTEEGASEAKAKKKSKTAMDYWLCAHSRKLAPERWREIRDLCRTYATLDAVRTMVLWLFYKKQMIEMDTYDTYKAEMELWPVTLWMEDRGVSIDLDRVEKLEAKYRKDMEVHKRAIDQYGRLALQAGVFKANVKWFNLNSHQQLAAILYDYLGLTSPPNHGSKKKKADRRTDQDALLELSVESGLPDRILRYRAAAKAVEFCIQYKSKAELRDGHHVLHADFNQVGPRTGRYSCRNPNLQQTASESTGRSVYPIDVRSPFGPAPKCRWFSADYSQQEPRIFADLSQESTMLEIIRSGKSIHKACADHVWGGFSQTAINAAEMALGMGVYSDQVDADPKRAKMIREVRDKYRTGKRALEAFEGSIVALEESVGKKNTVNKAKLCIFSKLYGGGAGTIMSLIKCTREYASQFLAEYEEGFPEMRPWMTGVIRKARKDGYVRTAFGRLIRIEPDFAYRAVNYIIQGSAADFVKRALRLCHAYLTKHLPNQAWILMVIHDEIVFEFLKTVPPMRHVAALRDIMADHGGVFGLNFPVEFKAINRSWIDKTPIPWLDKVA